LNRRAPRVRSSRPSAARAPKFRTGLPVAPPRASAPMKPRKWRYIIVPVLALAVIGVIAKAVTREAQTSYLQSYYLSRFAKDLTFSIQAGPSKEIAFPPGGPEDKRRGYSSLPGFLTSLSGRNFNITQQASWSGKLKEFAQASGYPVYHEKRD